jgi:prepilin signal peptidase PulO-like enzyme (type II secretory pathway)
MCVQGVFWYDKRESKIRRRNVIFGVDVVNAFVTQSKFSLQRLCILGMMGGLVAFASLAGWRTAAARGVWAATGLVFLAAVSWVDWRQRIIPGWLLLAGALFILTLRVILAPETLAGALAGAAIGLAIFWALARLADGQLGGGDVRLAGFVGLLTGAIWVTPALLLGMLLGGLLAFGLTVSGRARMDDGFPYGPALSLGASIILFWMIL